MGFPFNIPYGIDEDITLATAGTWKGLVSAKAPTANDVQLTGASCFFSGVAGDGEPIVLRLVRITVDSGTATAVTEVGTDNRVAGTIQTVGRKNFTALPTVTADTVLFGARIHPQGGVMVDLEFKKVWVARGTEVCLLALVKSGTPPMACGNLYGEE